MGVEAIKDSLGVTFNRYNKIEGSAELLPKFPDYYNSDSEGYSIRGGSNPKYILLSFLLPENPPFGSSYLKSLDLYYYTSAINPGLSSEAIALSAFKLRDTDYMNYDSSKVTARKGFKSGTAPTIAESNTKSPLFLTATNNNESLYGYSENFNGQDNMLSEDSDYVTFGRSVHAMMGPFMYPHDFRMYAQPNDNDTELPYSAWYNSNSGYKLTEIQHQHGTMIGEEKSPDEQSGHSRNKWIVRLKTHNARYYKTSDDFDGADTKYVRKAFEIAEVDGRTYTTGDFIHYSMNQGTDDGELYGDEVMPSNSMFTSVRGDKELLINNITEDDSGNQTGASVLGASAVRYLKEGAVSGQLCNFVSFMNTPESGDYYGEMPTIASVAGSIVNPMNVELTESKNYSDCVAAINNIPIPYPIGVPVPGLLAKQSGGYTHSGHSTDDPNSTYKNQQSFGGYSHPVIEINFTVDEMAPAFEYDVSASHFISGTARTFAILFSNLPCDASQYRLRDYLDQVTDTNNFESTSLNNTVAGIQFLLDGAGKLRMVNMAKLDLKTGTAAPTHLNHDYGYPIAQINDEADDTNFNVPINTPLKMLISFADPMDMNRVYIQLESEVDDAVGNKVNTIIASTQLKTNGPEFATSGSSLHDGGGPIGTPTDTNHRGSFAATSTDIDCSAPHMSFWATSTRVLKSGTGNGEQDINTIAKAPMKSSVSIDSIYFKNWNNHITNSTILRDETKIAAWTPSYMGAQINSGPQTYQNWAMIGRSITGDYIDWPSGERPSYGIKKTTTAEGKSAELSIQENFDAGADTLYNYIGKGYGGQAFVFGFKSRNDLQAVNRYMLFNGFNCLNVHQNDDIDSSMFTGGYTTPLVAGALTAAHSVPLGGQTLPCNIDPDISPNALKIGTTGSGEDFSIGSGNINNSVDTFTTHGWVKTDFDDTRAGPEGTTRSTWTSRECVLASARVIRAKRSGGAVVIQVDQTSPFRAEKDQEYIAYYYGADGGTNHYATGINVEKISENNTVLLNWNGVADDDSTDMLDDTNNKVKTLMIGPRAFWVWIMFGNFKDSASGLAWNGPASTGAASGWNNPNNLVPLPVKTYQSMLFTEGQGTPGATYNEWLFSHKEGENNALTSQIKGNYQARWNLSIGDEDDNMFDFTKDFGFGKFTLDDEVDRGFKGGEIGMSSPTLNKYAKLSMPKVVDEVDLKQGDFMSVFVRMTGVGGHEVSIKSENASTKDWVEPDSYEPFINAVYFDALPLPIEDFKFIPNEEDNYLPRLEWTSTDEDLWYGLVHFDTEPVHHQYHKSILHLPLNETNQASGVFFRDDPSQLLTVYNYENGEKSHTELGNHTSYNSAWYSPQYLWMDNKNVLTDPHGLAGNATVFGNGRYTSTSTLNGGDGNVLNRGCIALPVGTAKSVSSDDEIYGTGTTLPYNATVPSDGFSLSMHIVPDSKPLDRYQLKGAGGTAVTYSVNNIEETWEGYSSADVRHELKEELDASETNINIDCISAFSPSYTTGEYGIRNPMQEDWGTNWIASGEMQLPGATGDYDVDGSIIIKIDDEIMRVVSINPGTLTECTVNGTGLKLDAPYYGGSDGDSGLDLATTGRVIRVNSDNSINDSTKTDLRAGDLLLFPGRKLEGYYTAEIMKVGSTDGATAGFPGDPDIIYGYGGSRYNAEGSPWGRMVDASISNVDGIGWIGHVDLTDTTTTPSTNGEILLNNNALENITSIKCFDKDEDGDELDDGYSGVGKLLLTTNYTSFTHTDVTTYGRLMRIVPKSNPAESNAVYYNVTSGGAKVGDVYDLTVEWVAGRTGPVTSLFTDEQDVIISNYGKYNTTVTQTTAPAICLGNKLFNIGNGITAYGGYTSPKPETRSDYLPASGTAQIITDRYITVERGYGGTTATTHSINTDIKRVSENSPTIGGISALSELDNLDDSPSTKSPLGPHAYDSVNQDQIWAGAILDIGNERFTMPFSLVPDDDWESSGWARGIENTDWEIHDADTVHVIPRNYLFHGFTGNSLNVNSLNVLNGDLNQGANTVGKPVISVYLDSNGKINAHAYIENQNYKTPLMLQSKTAIPIDGVTPTHIGVVFDKHLPSQNFKLYLNGKLEDSTARRQTTGGTNNLQDNSDGQTGEPLLEGLGTICIGGLPYVTNTYSRSTNSFDGMIEEVTVWSKPVDFVNPEKGLYDYTKPYHELEDNQTRASSTTLYGKLFVKDYHNIRGTSPNQVRASPTAVLRKSAFALDTT